MDPYWTPRQNGIACKVIDSFGARTGSGKVTVVKANARWEVLAMNDLDEEVWATPAIASEISSSARATVLFRSEPVGLFETKPSLN